MEDAKIALIQFQVRAGAGVGRAGQSMGRVTEAQGCEPGLILP